MKALRIIPTVALIALVVPVALRAQDKDAQEVASAIASFKSSDAALAKWFDTAYGYAVFPSIGKGG
jgi:hypothetical protein